MNAVRNLFAYTLFLASLVGMRPIFSVTRNNDASSGIKISSTSTVKVKNTLTVKNGAVKVSANAKLEGVAVLSNSTLSKDGDIDVTVKSGNVINGSTLTVNGSTLNINASTVTQPITVSGNASLEGVPKNFVTIGSNGIVLANSATNLSIAVTSPIPTNIALAGGTLTLQGTTKLADGKKPSGPGTINCNSSAFVFGGAPLTLGSKLKIKNGADIQFNSTLTVTGELLFDGDANICGNGNILDLSSGGTIAINPNTTLNMTDLTIKGLGQGDGFGLGHIMFNDTTSRLLLSDVTIGLSRDYTVSNGGIYVIGPTTIATADHLFNFSLNGSLTVDGISLIYDTLGYPDDQNVGPSPYSDPYHKHITLINNGTIAMVLGGRYTQVPQLNGILIPLIQNNHYVFHKGNTGVRGFVRFCGGFTILPDASAVFDSCVTVSGPVDLRETGVLILVDDLSLCSNVTLSSGGVIDGRGHALKLGGNLTIPSNKIIHIMGDTIIDGGGHTLTVGDYGQLFIDNGMALTLQNMVLKSGPKTCVFPPVRSAGQTSKLVLDNVVIDPGADIPFSQGQLYVHNDVIFSGTSAFVYASSHSSFITSGATLTFDHGTTFSFAPSSASNDQIQLVDVTSRIILDGCTLKCTDTGMRLTKGSLFFDNKVMIDTKNGFYFSSLTTATMVNYGTSSSLVYAAAWSPDGKYLAIGGYLPASGAGGFTNTDEVRIYRFNGTTLTPVTSRDYGSLVYSIAWSPDGTYIAIGGNDPTSGGTTGFTNTDELRIYQFNGIALTPVTSRDYGIAIRTAAWSPDGKYLAIGGNLPASGAGGFTNTDEVRIYRFNGTTLTPVTSRDYGDVVYAIAWSPDGTYLAIGGYGTTSGGTTGFMNTDKLRIYQFNGTTLTPVTSKDYGTRVYSIAWSPDDKYMAIGGQNPVSGGTTGFDNNDELRIYQFNGTILTPVTSRDYGTSVRSIAWSPDGTYIAIGGGYPIASLNNSEVQIYAPVLGANSNPQAMSNSLVFGNSVLGSSADLNVKILSGAHVELRGQVFDDSV